MAEALMHTECKDSPYVTKSILMEGDRRDVINTHFARVLEKQLLFHVI